MRKKRARTPTILQLEAAECGAASLGMVLAYYQRYVPLETLREECSVSRDGSSAFNVIAAARKYGLEGAGLRFAIEELEEIELPAIILWGPAHYVVLEGFGTGCVYLNDPAKGKRSVSYAEFKEMYRTLVLSFKKTAQFQPGGIKPQNLIQRVIGYLKQVPDSFLFLIFSTICLLIPGFAFPAFLMIFIDTFFSKFHIPWHSTFLFLVIFMILFSAALIWSQLHLLNRLNGKLAARLSGNFLSRLLKLPIRYFENRNLAFLSHFLSSNENIANVITGSVSFVLAHVIFFFAFAFAMFAYDLSIAWIALSVGIFNIATMIFLYFSKGAADSLGQIERAAATNISLFGITNIETIQVKGSESNFFSVWAGIYTKTINQNQQLDKKNLILSILPPFFQMLAWAALLGIGALQIINGYLSPGKWMALGGLQMSFLIPIRILAELSPQILSLKTHSQNLDEVLTHRLDPIYETPKKAIEKEKLEGTFEFRNISFQYTLSSPPTIKNLSFKIEQGQQLAIVGSNGSGKTTLAKLAAGIYTPTSGEILYDEVLLKAIPDNLFRHSIAYVSQELFLFQGTIRENITLWNPKIPDEWIHEAALISGFHRTVSLRPMGYDSPISQGGNNLSATEKQLLQITRALLHSPNFVIFDNATCLMSLKLELSILNALKEKKISSLVISNRLAGLHGSDQILVLDGKGGIAEKGTPQELANREGIYQTFLKAEA